MFSPALTILTLGDCHEGHIFRDLAERMGSQVQLISLEGIGCLRTVLTLGDQLAGIVLISGGGDGIQALLNQGAVTEDARLQGQLVMSTAPRSGQVRLAEVLVAGGARAYIAPEESPATADVVLFVHVFLHAVLVEGRDIEAAMEHAHGYADAFTLFLA